MFQRPVSSTTSARRMRVLAASFGSCIIAFAAAVTALVFSGATADATSFTLTSTTPVTNWSDITRWNGGTGSLYPGQSPGDTVTMSLGGTTLNIDVAIPNPVQLNISSSIPVTIPSGSSLVLMPSSSATSQNTFTLNGGTLGVDSTANLSAWQGPITVNSGTFNVAGALGFSAGSSFTFNGGTMQGGGTLTIPSGHFASFAGTSGAMTLSNVTFDNFGTTTFNGSNNLAISSGAVFKNESGGAFNVSGTGNITSDNVSSPKITNLGTMSKSASTTTTIACGVDNSGTISPSSGIFELDGGGTDTGAFTLASSTSRIRFGGGTHNVNSGATITAGATGGLELTGGTLAINTALSVPSMTQSGGTLGGSGTFSTSGSYDWNGGTQDGTAGGGTSLGSSTFKMLPASAITLNGRAISGSGSWLYNPGAGGTLTLQNGAQMNLGGGTFDLQSDTAIIGDAASSFNILGGTLTKSTGTKTTVGCPLNVNGVGTLQPQGTTIAFGNGGLIGGTTVALNTSVSGSLLEFSGGTTNLSGGVTITSGNFLVSNSGVLSVNVANTVSALAESGGMLTGSAKLTAGTFDWTGGTIAAQGAGVSIINTGNITGGATTLANAAALINNGTVHYQPSAAMAVNSGGTINNNGVWALENGTSMTSDLTSFAAQSPQFFNSGTLQKLIAGTTALGVPFTASGPITLNNGADVELSAGATFNAGTLTFNSATDVLGMPGNTSQVPLASTFAISGPGTFRLNGSAVMLDSKGLTVPKLELGNGATWSESQTLNVTTAFKATGGTLNGGGSTTLANGSTSDLTSLAGNFTLNSHTLNNGGTMSYNPTFPIAFQGNAQFNNLSTGIVNITGAGGTSTSSTGNGFSNAGTINRSGAPTYFTFDLPFTNTGTVNVTGANDFLAFAGGATMSAGAIQGTVPTAGIEITNSTYPFVVTGGSFGTAGIVRLNGGMLTVNANVNTPATFNEITGTLTGSAVLTVPSGATATISGGSIYNTTLTAASGGTLNFDTTTFPAISGSTVNVNSGATSTVTGTNGVQFNNSAVLNNAGTFNLGSDAPLSTIGATTINNSGTFRKNGGTGVSSVQPLLVNTGGAFLQAQQGTLSIDGGGSLTGGGAFVINSGATVQFTGGTFDFNSAASTNPQGTMAITGGTVNVNFLLGTVGFLNLTGGTLNVPASQTLTVGGAVTLNGGTITGAGVTQMTNPSGTTAISSTATSTITGGQTFRNYGAATFLGTATNVLSLTNGANFENEAGATFTGTTDGIVGGDATATFKNFGTVTRSGGTYTQFNVPFTNTGTVNAVPGRIVFNNGGSSTGTLGAGTSSALEFSAGTFQVTGGTMPFGSGSSLKMTGGTLTLNIAASTPQLLMSNGTLADNAGLSFAGGTWSGGTIGGSGTTTNTGLLTLTGSTTSASLSAHSFTNSGTLNYAPTTFSLSLDNGATLTNSGAGLFDIQSDTPIVSSGATSSIVNAATLKKSVGVATTIAANLNNSGTMLASTGTMTFNNFTQTAGTTTLGPGSLGASALTFSGGSLTGTGSLIGNVSVGNANISPGTGPATGAISVTGNYTQTAGTFNTRIGGTGAAQFDHLDATGAVTLSGGTLNASFFNAFSPASGNTFDVVNFGSKSGDFATKNLPTFPAGGSMTASYTPTSLRLAAIVTQADIQTSQSGPSSVLHNQNDVITVTITNLGSTPSNAVTVSDSFGGATFVSANPSQGTCAAPSGGTFTCSLGTLNGTSSATITLTLSASSVGTITNNAAASSTTFDPNTANNNATPYSATVLTSSDLGVSITDSPDPVPASGNITYVAALTNAGPDASGSIPVTLTISGGNIVSMSATGPCSPANATTWNCTATSLASGGSSNITVLAQATSPTLVQLSAVVNYVQDPNTGNNSASQSTTVNASADIAITKSGPASATPGTIVTYIVNVTSNGPSNANGVVVSDPAPARLQFLSLSSSSGCIAFPCNVGLLTAGSTVVLQAHYKVTPGAPGPITNTATVTATTQDPSPGNNTASAQTQLTCASQPPQITAPAAASTSVPTTGVITWNNAGFTSYNVYFGKKGAACNLVTPTATVSGTSFSFTNLDSNADYEVRIEGVSSGCPNISSACLTFRTGVNCATQPVPVSPINTTATSPVHFAWTLVPGATQYEVFLSSGALASSIGTTGATSLDANAGDGAFSWFVVATVPGCGTVTGPTATFNVCNDSVAPVAGVVAQAAAGQSYAVQWDAIPGATKYEIDEAQNAQFTGATTQTVTTTSVGYQHNAQNAPQAWFYRVRAFGGCKQAFSSDSQTVRVVIVPIPKNQQNSNVNVPAGSTTPVTQDIFIPGIAGGTFSFFATGDKPWITVSPASGVLTPDGVTLQVSANPADLPNGTFTGTVLLTVTPLSVAGTAHGTATSSTVAVPVSVSLVTPVIPTTNSAAAASTLIIPSVGHLDGLDSHWQSDIRVANTSASAQKYTLTFNPSDNSGVKSTNVSIDAGATIALDDIVKNWYGIGALGEAANGVLSIRPTTTSTLPGQQLTSVASSRTYNVAASGTLGQYIPAVPFGSFIGAAAAKRVASILSLQQIAQSAQYRTNFGIVEASGQPATVMLSIFNASGSKLKDLTFDVKPFEQLQLNSMLATNGIPSLSDGRVEAKVLSGGGKVTTYASVVDNNTQDPLLVSGVPLGTTTSKDYVLPGVADLNSPFASWRTDMRVFNSGTAPQLATLTFYPLGNNGTPQTTTLSINPGEVKTIDNTLQTLFGSAAANLGGAIHVSTLNDSSLVVTGRTFNKTDAGTYGQFIPAITPADAVGNGGRTLQILQVEDSPRYRTNLGIAEVTGKPVTVEVTVILPDSRVSPRIEIPLAANEYRQEALLSEIGLGNVYNARIAVRVIGGEGKIAAYGSVIDRQTQDPTYVPAQ
jgi:hypothetical protein